MTASISSNAPLISPQASPMSFSGRGGEFLKMLIAGSLYQIPTFGFYRFWLTTKLRRHLWANTQVEGESFEYTGTAKELLVGFLIALAVLAPLYIALFVLSLAFEEIAAFASIPLILILYVLAHFGSYRARRYRATRTVFRGVRFWMKGSGWAYAFRAIMWDFATILTIGLALPWAMASLERYRMRHTYFGTVQGDFSGTGWTLFKRGWWVWAIGIVLIAGLGLGSAEVFNSLADMDLDLGEDMDASKAAAYLAAQIAVGGLLLIYIVLMPLVMAIFTRWYLDGLRFGEATVSSQLRIGTFYGLFFKTLFSSIGFLIAFGLVFALGASVAGAFFQDAMSDIQANQWTAGAIVIGLLGAIAYLVLLLGFGVIQRYFYGRGLWAAIVTTTTVSNLSSLNAAGAAGQPAGTMGEGLADALDFNVGI
ncbi:DUF898 family protein [Microvirga guangxiensis]|uniref:Uncharacterized membrane protein YjgN, DUF898 family n=1 Tax=Microvirga guangxiensis TaxID=549386 RepID=A0A1G5JRZ9_9HYPH|nr:DUF898 family protein [Microvirga guangxiensis]SCY90681.1 Uncharacterized membrane protein YjgN, DUF898 family [Microvirga guangxiensis]